MPSSDDNPLGQSTEYPSKYAPELLYPIPRWAARSLLDIDKKIRFYGFDHWRAYELSWLDGTGKPRIAALELFFNAESENLVESKSLKLYLNSFNNEHYASAEDLLEVIRRDLSSLSKSEVKLVLKSMDELSRASLGTAEGRSIDTEPLSQLSSQPDENLLKTVAEPVFDEVLRSDLFRSNCPVTAQPDWASVQISYSGTKIEAASLLAYLTSFREHQGYHEECAERIFRDLMLQCQPVELTVAMQYLRRGGIEINVYRSTQILKSDMVAPRLARQ